METKDAGQDPLGPHDRWSKMCCKEDASIVFSRSENGAEICHIDLDRCSTPEAILGWVDHLSDKTWITREYIQLFVQFATGHHGIQIYPLPREARGTRV